MKEDESSPGEFKRCLVAAVVRCFQDTHRRSMMQICEAFRLHWSFPPPGMELGFIWLNEGWFSPDIQRSLIELAERGWVELVDGSNSSMLKHFFDVRCMASIYAEYPIICEHLQWIIMTAIRIEESLRARPDPYAP